MGYSLLYRSDDNDDVTPGQVSTSRDCSHLYDELVVGHVLWKGERVPVNRRLGVPA